MNETSDSEIVSTKTERIVKLAQQAPDMVIKTLAHHVDMSWLREAYRRTRKRGATGVDGQTAEEYAQQLESNLAKLLEQAKSGSYRAPPVRRVHIPKGNGQSRRLASQPSRTRCFSGRSRCCWKQCTSRTSWIARTASGLDGVHTRR